MGIDLDGLIGATLIEAVDAHGRLTDDPTTAVEGTLVLSYDDGHERWINFDRAHAIPPAKVSA